MEHASLSFEDRPLARRRLGVTALVYATRALCALLIAWPFASLFGRALGAFPRGDLLLFEPGGLYLIESVRRTREAFAPISTGAVLLLVTYTFVGLLPLAALLGSLSVKGRLSARDLGSLAFRPVGTFALLLGGFSVLQGILLGLLVALGGVVAKRASSALPTSDRINVVFVLFALLVVAAVGVLHDLARASAVRGDLGFRASLRVAVSTLRGAPFAVFWGFAWRGGLGLLLLAAGVVFGSRLGVEPAWRLFLGFLVHQGAVFGALCLRASWLAKALREVSVVLTPKAESAVALALSATAVDADAGSPMVSPLVEAPLPSESVGTEGGLSLEKKVEVEGGNDA